MALKLLIVTTAADLLEPLRLGVRLVWPAGRVLEARSPEMAYRIVSAELPQMIVLDAAALPGACDICRQLRDRTSAAIVMIGVEGTKLESVRALDAGADDYLARPIDPLELIARLRAIERRAGAAGSDTERSLTIDDLTIDFTTRTVWRRGACVHLTTTEYRLLEVLARHAGNVLPHRVLMEQVWGSEYVGDTSYLKVFVRRLRRKLGDDPEQPRYIQNEWGVGYRFVAPAAPQAVLDH